MNLCLRDGFSPNVINTAPRIHLLIYMLKLRRGLTFLPSSYVNEYVKKDYPELIVKPFRHNITREMAVIYSPGALFVLRCKRSCAFYTGLLQ